MNWAERERFKKLFCAYCLSEQGVKDAEWYRPTACKRHDRIVGMLVRAGQRVSIEAVTGFKPSLG